MWLEADLSQEDINWLKKQLSNYQLIIHAPFTSMSLVSGHKLIDEASIKILKKTIDQSIALNAKLITVHTGKYPVYSTPKKASEFFSQNFQKLVNYANEKIILTTENMPIRRGAEIHFPMLKELGNLSKLIPNINYTLDIGHCIQNGEDFYQFITDNKDKIKDIHFHNAIKNGKAHYGLHLKGDLDFKKLVDFLNKINYQNYLTLEVLDDEDKIESIKLINTLFG
ncbi:MAG: sugar phosphate isomerase/epimerase [Candidatus Shapirobacteria bacterium]|nr:sugar phosphate isomerase/epimerase [Candidatus Shapirobacteria bacterium]MDD3002356.1 sugar phosphate isomerase/epimerase [Candidatus Shapirobacteria bacterium]MDD4383336.1 sugar phosphate isomerase/epimerase [Candidatus Shapirobacteria bacterium]